MSSTIDLNRPPAVGCTAEVFEWRPGEVIKLFRDGFPTDLCDAELATARSLVVFLSARAGTSRADLRRLIFRRFTTVYVRTMATLSGRRRREFRRTVQAWIPPITAARLREHIPGQDEVLLPLVRRFLAGQPNGRAYIARYCS